MKCEFDSFLSSISQKQRNCQIGQPKFISATNWQKNMAQCLKNMMKKYSQKKNLIVDLMTIVNSVPQSNFVEATLKIRPFKPQFTQIISVLDTASQSTVAQSIANNVRFCQHKIKNHEQLKKRLRTTEKTLRSQFDKDYHPFKFIISNFKRLIELKFKSLVDSKKMMTLNKITSQLRSDMEIFHEFMHKASQPYKKLFKFSTQDKNYQESVNKFEDFIDTFLVENDKLNKCIHKVICYGCNFLYQEKIYSYLENLNPEDFNLSDQFKIEGGYIRAMSSMMQFSQSSNPEKSMKILFELRENILIDIRQFYVDRKVQKMLEVSAETQIQIIRSCIAKVKGWAAQILAQLKFLQYFYGEEQVAFKYQQSSYMYTQISMAYQIMGLDI